MIVFSFVALVVACGNGRTSSETLQHKIDSVYRLEQMRQLRLQGIKFEDASPFQMFYDSLSMQALPVSYSEDYVKFLPGFTVVPISIMTYLELEGRVAPKAIALPETIGARLVLLAADLEDGEYELWLYSLDEEYYPVDKLLLYEPQKVSDTELPTHTHEPYFSITSDLEIQLIEFTDENDRRGQLSAFVVDNSRMFVEKSTLF